MKYLYIIGNGFDKHHGIESGFGDYGIWLKKNHPDLFFQLSSIYGISEEKDWWNFEQILGELNISDQVAEIMENRRPDWKNLPDDDRAFNNAKRDYEAAPEEAQYTFEELFNNIRYTFVEWVKQLNEPESSQMIHIKKQDSVFISFNYTNTLESLYKIASDFVIYIHGCAKRGDELVLGHGKTIKQIENEYLPQPPDDADTPELIEQFYANASDWVEEETYMEIIQRLAKQRKPMEYLIHKIYNIRHQIAEIEHIYIFGFSFSNIDMPYIKEIADIINRKRVLWKVSYYNPSDEIRFRDKLIHLGIPQKQIIMTTLESLNKNRNAPDISI